MRSLLITAAVLIAAGFSAGFFWIAGAARSALPWIGLCVGVFAALSAILLIGSAHKSGSEPVGGAFFFALLFIGLAFTVALPPFLSPDEQSHYATVYSYANRLLRQEGAEDAVLSESIGLTDRIITFRAGDAKLMETLATSKTDVASVWEPILSGFSWRDPGGERVARTRITYPYAVTGYLFSTAGLALGRALDLGGIPCLFLARFCNLLFACTLTYIAVRRARALGRLLIVSALLPMSVSLTASLSPDAVLIPLAYFAFSELMRLLLSERTLQTKDLLPTALAMMLLCPLKIHCAPLALSVLALTPKRFSSKRAYVFSVYGTVLLAALACVYENRTALLNVLSGSGAYVAQGYSLSFVLQNPLVAAGMIGRTFLLQLPALSLCLAGHLLGQLNVPMPSYFYTLCYLLLLCFSALRTPHEKSLPRGTRALFFTLSALTVVAAYAVMLIWWTDAGSATINGVQGRYFLPAVPFLLTVLYGRCALPFHSERALISTAALFNTFTVLWCFLYVLTIN